MLELGHGFDNELVANVEGWSRLLGAMESTIEDDNYQLIDQVLHLGIGDETEHALVEMVVAELPHDTINILLRILVLETEVWMHLLPKVVEAVDIIMRAIPVHRPP